MSFLLLGYIACQTNADKSQSLLSAYSKVQQYTWAKFSFYVWGANPPLPLALEVGPLGSISSSLPCPSLPSFLPSLSLEVGPHIYS